MRAVKSKHTRPEKLLRSALHRTGFRFRLHRRSLPGNPDLVFVRQKKVIFVNGCFWHLHNCPNVRRPTTNLSYWLPKLEGNRARDKRNRRALSALGWGSLTVWECHLKSPDRAVARAIRFLRGLRAMSENRRPQARCAECNSIRDVYARGLCETCYARSRQRPGKCANCKRNRRLYAKGECKTCRDALYRGLR